MTAWPSAKARRVLAALIRIGVKPVPTRRLTRAGWFDYVFAFHDNDEIGPRMLARIARHTGLARGDL
jgi:hypothetical protein